MESRQIRKEYGLPQFEHKCRLTHEMGRKKKAYKVPGTQENGTYMMLLYQIEMKYGRDISLQCPK